MFPTINVHSFIGRNMVLSGLRNRQHVQQHADSSFARELSKADNQIDL